MPDIASYFSALVFDPPVAYPAIGGVVVGLVLAVVARRIWRQPLTVWFWTLSALALAAGFTGLVLSLGAEPRDVVAYAAASAGLTAAVVGLLVAKLLFSESRRPAFDVQQTVGRRAQVYQEVPAGGVGVGRVRVHAAGRSVLLSAVSAGPDIPRYAFVRVCAGTPDGRVLVEAEDAAG